MGQSFTIDSNVVSSGAGGLSYQWVNGTNNTPNAISGANLPSYNDIGGTTGMFTYYLIVNDVADNNAISNNALVIVDIPKTTISTTTTIVTTTASNGGIMGSSGTSGSEGSGGGNVTSIVAYNNSSVGQTGYEILNFTSGHTQTFSIDGDQFTITLNFIAPTSAGVTINGNSYTLGLGDAQLLDESPSYAYYASLASISYLPSFPNINLILYGASLQQPTTTAESTTTTIALTTTVLPGNVTTILPAQTAPGGSNTSVSSGGVASSTLVSLGGIGVAVAVAVAAGVAYSRVRKTENEEKHHR